MNPIIQEILQKGFTLEMSINSTNHYIQYVLHGFYKSDYITLVERVGYDDNSLMAEARYNELTIINSFDDLVMLNYGWWNYSKDRSDGWRAPDENWLPFFLERNLVKVETETKTTYK